MNIKTIRRPIALLLAALLALCVLPLTPLTAKAAAFTDASIALSLDDHESEAPFPATAKAAKSLKVYGVQSLKGRALVTIAKGESFTVLTLGDNRKTLLVEYEGKQCYIAARGLLVRFPEGSVSIYNVSKARRYLQHANGKLKSAGYFSKGTTICISGISGDYMLIPYAGTTYWVKAADWLFPIS